MNGEIPVFWKLIYRVVYLLFRIWTTNFFHLKTPKVILDVTEKSNNEPKWGYQLLTMKLWYDAVWLFCFGSEERLLLYANNPETLQCPKYEIRACIAEIRHKTIKNVLKIEWVERVAAMSAVVAIWSTLFVFIICSTTEQYWAV